MAVHEVRTSASNPNPMSLRSVQFWLPSHGFGRLFEPSKPVSEPPRGRKNPKVSWAQWHSSWPSWDNGTGKASTLQHLPWAFNIYSRYLMCTCLKWWLVDLQSIYLQYFRMFMHMPLRIGTAVDIPWTRPQKRKKSKQTNNKCNQKTSNHKIDRIDFNHSSPISKIKQYLCYCY